MNDKQRRAMMKYWWPQACRAQGWRANDRNLRLRVLSLAVTFTFADVLEFRDALEAYDKIRHLPVGDGRRFRHLESAGELNETTDIDAVKNLLLMLNDSLKAADEHDKPEIGQGRRHRNVIEEKILCLSQYPLDKPMGLAGARAFCQEILNDKFNRGRQHQHLALEDVDDRPRFVEDKKTGKLIEKPSQKEMLLYTLNECLHGSGKEVNGKKKRLGFRVAAGHSVHDMLTNVKLPCACRKCTRAALAAQMPAGIIQPVSPIIEPAAVELDPELEPAAVADPELGESYTTGDQPF